MIHESARRFVALPVVLLVFLGACNEAPESVNYDPESPAAILQKEGRSIPVDAADEATGALFDFSKVNFQLSSRDGDPRELSADANILLKKRKWEIRYHRGDRILHTETVEGRAGNLYDFVDLRSLCDSGIVKEIPTRITVRLLEP